MYVCVRALQIVADIYEPQGIKFVDAAASFLTNDLLSLVDTTVTETKVNTNTAHCFLVRVFFSVICIHNSIPCSKFCTLQAHITFLPTLEQQQKCQGCKETIIDGDFTIKYDVKREKALEDVQVRNKPDRIIKGFALQILGLSETNVTGPND